MAETDKMKDRKDQIHEMNLELKAIRRELKYIRAKVDKTVEEADYLISVKVAAKMLHISAYTLRKEIREGNFKAQRTGRAYKLSFLYVQKLVSGQYK